MLDFTILTENDACKYGYGFELTDFAVLLGAAERSFWTRDIIGGEPSVRIISPNSLGLDANRRRAGARPAISYSSISRMASNPTNKKSGMFEVEYGEYPQTIVSDELAKEIEKSYTNGTLKQTGKSYTTDSVPDSCNYCPFEAETHTEYAYNGKKYIRVVGKDMVATVKRDRYFSNGKKLSVGEVYWVEVEPIKWIVNEETNMALSKNIIFSGVQFNESKQYYGNFEQTSIKKFMDQYFAKDIVSGKDIGETLDNNYDKRSLKDSYDSVEKRISSINLLLSEVNEKITIYETGVLFGSEALVNGISVDGLSEAFVDKMNKSLTALRMAEEHLGQQLQLCQKEKELYGKKIQGLIDDFEFNIEFLKIRADFDLLMARAELYGMSKSTSDDKKR